MLTINVCNQCRQFLSRIGFQMLRAATERQQYISEVGTKHFHPWKIAIWLLAALPTIFIVATWDSDGLQSPAAFMVRHLSLPITIGELCVILLAMRAKFSVANAIRGLPIYVKLLIYVWACFAVMSVAMSGQQWSLLIFTTMRYALHGVFLAACIHISKNATDEDRDSGIGILSLGALAYVFFLAVFAFTVPNKPEFPWTLRLPTGTNVRQIGYFVAIAAVAPISLLLFGRLKTILYAVAVIVLVACTAWTGSRGALTGLILGTVAAGCIFGRLPTISRTVAAIISVATGLYISLFIPNPSPEFGLLRMTRTLAQEDISSGRSSVWNSTLTEIFKAPWTGHGAGSFNQNMHKIYGFDFNHPHQFFLQYVYDWGVFGGAAGLLLLLVLFVSCWRHASLRKDASGYAAIAVLCVLAAVGMIDGALFYPFSIFLALAIVACNFVNDGTIVAQMTNKVAQ